MKFSIQKTLVFIATVAIVLGIDQNLESRLSQLKTKLAAQHQTLVSSRLQATDSQHPALQSAVRWHGVDSNGVGLENKTTVFDRMTFHRRLHVKFLKINGIGVMGAYGSVVEENWVITPFETADDFFSRLTTTF